jgi:hypothetical protein
MTRRPKTRASDGMGMDECERGEERREGKDDESAGRSGGEDFSRPVPACARVKGMP